MCKRLILVRHGQTDMLKRKKYCGATDIGLNAQGREQARLLRKRLAAENIREIYSSDMKRAMEFCSIAFKGEHFVKEPGLREMNFGIFEGLDNDEILKKYPAEYGKWLNDPYKNSIPGGESLKAFEERVIRAYKGIIIGDKSKNLAIVAHGGTIKIILRKIMKKKKEYIWGIAQDAGCINIIDFRKGNAEVSALNDTAYQNE